MKENDKLKKSALMLTSVFIAASLALPSNFAAAQENSGLTLLETNSYEKNGEQFDLQTWTDENGIKTYTVPTEVNNKKEVSEFVSELVKEKEMGLSAFSIAANSYGSWSKPLLQGRDGDSGSYWNVSGQNDRDIYGTVGLLRMGIDKGYFTINWYGSGTPSKIVSSYSYQFNGGTVTISAPPSMYKSGKTVSFRSEPVSNTWNLTTTSEAASATSVLFANTDIKAGGEVYVGSRIYQPISSASISLFES